jgi:hypothetical protein
MPPRATHFVVIEAAAQSVKNEASNRAHANRYKQTQETTAERKHATHVIFLSMGQCAQNETTSARPKGACCAASDAEGGAGGPPMA